MAENKTPDRDGAAAPKRKADDAAANVSPQASQTTRKEQKTLEETVPDDDMRNAANEAGSRHEDTANSKDETKEEEHAESGDAPKPERIDGSSDVKPDEATVEESSQRGKDMPSNILEKGIFYFLSRGRVGTDTLESVQDIARSYLILRPLPANAKINPEGGPLEDLENNRLLALPKKVLPQSGKDNFLTFVEKSGTTIHALKEEFMHGSSYDTKTTGVRHTPPVTPLGEGVYAITSTGRDSHLAYMLTVPSEPGEVQHGVGLKQQGSFHLSTKNPEAPGPANTSLPQGPGWPEEVQREFEGRRWVPLAPKHLDYPSAQFLLIGEGVGELRGAVEQTTRDAKHEKETPAGEMERLEGEDEVRANKLEGADAIFADLGLSRNDYPNLKVSW
ncbi:MAG: hypothetical protein M1831_005356 [Alyxoria varia]|nr:MAG: hypothetical protein M1831_005356 [Alyxoria varia]